MINLKKQTKKYSVYSLPERMVKKITIVDDCWVWTGYCSPTKPPRYRPYGRVAYKGKTRFAHRVSYELLLGPLFENMEIDHLCRNTRCLNPSHLEQVKPHINKARAGFARKRKIDTGCVGVGWNKEQLEEWGLLVDKWDNKEVLEDEPPEVSQEPPISKLGEVYQLGRHRLMCGDSTKIEDVERLMDGKKADMVFTDPPYGMDFQSNFREKTPQFEKLKNDDVILDVAPVLHSFMKQDSVAYICTRWDLYPQWYQQIEKIFDIKNCVVWYKKGGGLGDLENSYLPNHEFIIVAHKGQSRLRGKRDADVWQIGRDGFNDYEHPTQKPVALSAFAIEHHSDSSSLIIDLFLGSGSTLIACEQTDRTCYGMELDEKYCDVIRKRYAKFIGKEDLWQETTPIVKQ